MGKTNKYPAAAGLPNPPNNTLAMAKAIQDMKTKNYARKLNLASFCNNQQTKFDDGDEEHNQLCRQGLRRYERNRQR